MVSSNLDIALIAGGWTALVGVAGFGATILATSKTIRNARKEKVRDWRAAVYVDVLAAVSYRQFRRLTDTASIDDEPSDVQWSTDTYQVPDWQNLEARLLSFGSEPVFTATQASSAAHFKAVRAFNAWARDQSPESRNAARDARQAADDADDVVAERVRVDLQGKGKPIVSWNPDPK